MGRKKNPLFTLTCQSGESRRCYGEQRRDIFLWIKTQSLSSHWNDFLCFPIPYRQIDALVRHLRRLFRRRPQDRLHQVQVTLGWELAPAGHHVHVRHTGCFAVLPGTSTALSCVLRLMFKCSEHPVSSIPPGIVFVGGSSYMVLVMIFWVFSHATICPHTPVFQAVFLYTLIHKAVYIGGSGGVGSK